MLKPKFYRRSGGANKNFPSHINGDGTNTFQEQRKNRRKSKNKKKQKKREL